jgi:hypothetical protein
MRVDHSAGRRQGTWPRPAESCPADSARSGGGEPAGRTLRSVDLPPPALNQITWDNCFGFLGITRADI